jgi:CRP-like cAMP-binding protein
MVEKTAGWEFHITEMDLFNGLDLTVMGQIADTACTEAAYADATVVFNEGDPAKALFILVSGSVDLQLSGGKTVYRLTEASDIFGWSSLVENARYTATAIARSDIQAVKIDTRLMNRVFDANPMVGLTVYRRLGAVFNKRLASIYQRFLSV